MSERGRSSQRRPRMGRPPGLRKKVRSNRVVTFVTDSDLEKLERMADAERSSLSLVVNRILSRYLESQHGRS